MKKIVLDGNSLTIDDAVSAANPPARISLAKGVRKNVDRSRAVIERAVQQKKSVYGVTTGFGAFSDIVISREECRRLQKNVLMSHAAGVGKPLPDNAVRPPMPTRTSTC